MYTHGSGNRERALNQGPVLQILETEVVRLGKKQRNHLAPCFALIFSYSIFYLPET